MYPSTRKSEQGFLLPVAVFLLIAMSLMALALTRMSASSNLSVVQEIITVNSFYAAESGAQRAMASLFFPDDSSRQLIDQRCSQMALNINFAATGLDICSAQVSCSCRYENAGACDHTDNGNYTLEGPVVKSFYQLTSVGQCASGGVSASRTLEVEAYAEQN